MNRLSIATLVVCAAALLAASAFAEELAIPKPGEDWIPPRVLNWEDVNGDDAYGDNNRNGDTYVEEGTYHGGQGTGDPDGPWGDFDDEEIAPTIPVGLVGVKFGGR